MEGVALRPRTGAARMVVPLTLLLVLGMAGPGAGVGMSGKGVTVSVENGTQDSVVLDCPFSMEEDDTLVSLVINWYFKNTLSPVYQWIPMMNRLPQAIGFLKGRVDVEYEVEGVEGDEQEVHRHRALRLLQPTTELTGTYFCRVSSNTNFRTLAHNLVVYSLPDSMEVRTAEEERGGKKGVVVRCEVEGVFPQPSLALTHTNLNTGDRAEVQRVRRVATTEAGVYSMEAEGWVADSVLDDLTEFTCHMTINGTEVDITEVAKYQPSKEIKTGAVIGSGTKNYALSAFIPLILLVLRLL